MQRQQRLILTIAVLIAAFIVVFRATSTVEIDQDTLENLALEKSTSSDESEERQYISHLIFQQAGIITALLLLPVGLVFLKNRSLAKQLSGKFTNRSQTTTNAPHKSFAEKLLNTYPALTAYDLSLCEMLADKLSSKEIATRLNISPSSVNTARYRLRKKLKVPQQVELISFLHQFRP